jgi:NAD(P)-dependent dehydrogenase (short-subunit alcohol dehydrogenase family)
VSGIFRLDGKVALVTGASSGLGRHFAACLAEAGAAVAIAARRTDRLAVLADEIAAAGGRACPVALDVTDSASIERAVAAAEAALGPIDVLINNSGLGGPPSRAVELDEADWDAVLDTNLKGAWLVARAVSRAMIAGGRGGSIVNIASVLGIRVAAGVAAYAASKAGLVQLTRAMALELARHGIRVNAIAPGYITTDINRDFLEGPAGQKMVQRVPQRRVGEARDLDGALLLLASEAGRYMTGAIIPVDGGHLVSTL